MSFTNNKILQAGKTLLCFLSELSLEKDKIAFESSYVQSIHRKLLAEIQQFQLSLSNQKLHPTQLLAASYCLCSCLDEMIMNSKLCINYNWSKQSLLSITHNETWGGERFYLILNYALKNPKEYLELLELIYLLFSFGYRGKLYQTNSHENKILFKKIAKIILEQKENSDETKDIVKPDQNQGNRHKITSLTLKYLAIVMLALNLVSFINYNFKLRSLGQEQISKIKKLI
ncbi:MAG TPA: type IVB secretion system protein IcmH/DotU [Coxiellaceae bacterium]|nr:type IVB secretion system protein IcmH/DotU [Coxiellaceae bacterium]